MGYQIGDRKLPLDIAFDHNEIQYPANWLRLSTAEQRDELGITWVADTSQNYDQRFYWGVDNPKDLDGLKTLWKATQSQIAATLLAPSDWRVIKAKERGSTMNADWKTWRQTIRTECGTMVSAIEATADVGDTAPHADFGRVEALQQYIEGGTYNVWTADPDNAAE